MQTELQKQGERLDRIEVRLDGIDERLDRMDECLQKWSDEIDSEMIALRLHVEYEKLMRKVNESNVLNNF